MEATQSRYVHLLQPIRELTKNWDIDLASELNDYLDELDEMCITFDGGKTRLNFAEAALLIQGSASIYSKKVELLHSLVFQTLEFISDRNRKRNKQAAASQDDDRATDHHDHGNQDEFRPPKLQESENSETCDSNMMVEVIPLPPQSLIPPETREKQKLPLISVKGDIVCSVKDFKINLFIPGDEDMILLRHRSTVDRFLMLQQNSTEFHPQQLLTDAEAPVGGAEAEGFEAEDVGGEAAEDFMDVEEHVDRHQGSAPSEGRMIRERRQIEADKRKKMDEVQPEDVWTLHDAYAVLDGEKTIKLGKCYKVPDGLDDGGKRKRKAASALQDFSSWIRRTYDPSEHKLKNGPKFTDLNYIYLNTMEQRLKTQRRINRRAGLVVSDDDMRRTFLQREGAGLNDQGEEPVDRFISPDLPGGDDDNFDNLEVFPDEGDGGADFISPEAQRDELSYEDLVMLRVEQLVANSQAYTQETALSRRVKDWEEKIRPHLQLQEERPTFDIHDYGDRVVESLGAISHRRFFSSIVHGLDPTEVCRFLLASLQLANDLTVQIDSAAGLEDSLDTMSLILLSTQRATDRFKTDRLQLKISDPAAPSFRPVDL
ncbi:condensin-2 complex subunit H2 [Amphiprion ocellaris]|uniref:Condensin-2 complex subunit H2 n=1 Tax=Amphiprion ocellaris TaxID=80972 RepID=A0A3Q1CH14_AMPOC|nr:condensin-2 complex subunit H2 [Amphiprion ocellaris]